MTLLWGLAVLLLLLPAAVAHGDTEHSCKYIELEGQHKDCQGIWKVSNAGRLQYRNEKEGSGTEFKWPEVGENLAQVNYDMTTMTCFEGLDTNKVREQKVPYKCAGFTHITGVDTNVNSGSHWTCQYVQVTNFETRHESLWGFYYQEHELEFSKISDKWGNPSGGRMRIQSADRHGVKVTGYNEKDEFVENFFIHRKRCQGNTEAGKGLRVYADREEQNNAALNDTCWMLHVKDGPCGKGLFARLFYDDDEAEWKFNYYRRWKTKILVESDLYQQIHWTLPSSDRDQITHNSQSDEFHCKDKGALKRDSVECYGPSKMEFIDRPLPYKYIDWLAKTDKFTSDRFGECKMYRLLKAHGDLKQGFYVQTANAEEYLNEEMHVVMGLNGGKWAAKDGHFVWDKEGYVERTDPDPRVGAWTSHMEPNHHRWTCVSAASYCGHITVTANETPAGMCQGRWRLRRRNAYSRFDQEIITGNNNQEIVDRTFDGESMLLTISADHKMNIKGYCRHDKTKFSVEFDIPRSRCFTHGTFRWDQVDYDPPFKL